MLTLTLLYQLQSLNDAMAQLGIFGMHYQLVLSVHLRLHFTLQVRRRRPNGLERVQCSSGLQAPINT